MKRIFASVYSWFLLILMAAGEIVVAFFYAWRQSGLSALVWTICGFLAACILAPTLHECGHILFAGSQGMKIKMTKFSFFRFFVFRYNIQGLNYMESVFLPPFLSK